MVYLVRESRRDDRPLADRHVRRDPARRRAGVHRRAARRRVRRDRSLRVALPDLEGCRTGGGGAARGAARTVMREIGYDLSRNPTKGVDDPRIREVRDAIADRLRAWGGEVITGYAQSR